MRPIAKMLALAAQRRESAVAGASNAHGAELPHTICAGHGMAGRHAVVTGDMLGLRVKH